MKLSGLWMTGCAVLFAAVAILGWRPLLAKDEGGKAARGQSAAQAVVVRVATARLQDVPLRIAALGTVVPAQAVAVKSRVDSQIVGVDFHDGDDVAAGDVLFRLDDRALKAQLDQAKAGLARDQAQLEYLGRQYGRNKDLVLQKAVSQSVFEDSEAALRAQQAAVASDGAAVESLEVQLSYTVIRAPIGGRTGTVNVTAGNTVKANDTGALVVINQIRPVRVQAALPQDRFAEVRTAQEAGPVGATARPSGGPPVSGVLAYIDNAIDQSTGTFTVRAEFPNGDQRLWPGMLVNLTIDTGVEKGAMTVPGVAVQNGPSGTFVYVVDGGKARKENVEVSRMQDGFAVLTGDAVKEGENVAVDGMLSLDDGAAVTVKPQ